MRTVTIAEEGVDTSSLPVRFGEAITIADEAELLIQMVQTTYREVIPLEMRCLITDDHWIQLIAIRMNRPPAIEAQFRITGKPLKEVLSEALRKYFEVTSFWIGYPKYYNSPVPTEIEFEALFNGFSNTREETMRIAQNQDPP